MMYKCGNEEIAKEIEKCCQKGSKREELIFLKFYYPNLFFSFN